MNILNIAAALGISALIAIGGTAPVANTSETGITRTSRTSTEVTRESRGSSQQEAETVTLRGETELAYANYESMDIIIFMRIDMGSPSAAEMAVGLIADESPYLADALDGFNIDGTFRISGAGTCSGKTGQMDGMRVYLATCASGSYAHLILGTDKQVVIDTAQSAYQDGVFVVPAGYVEEDF